MTVALVNNYYVYSYSIKTHLEEHKKTVRHASVKNSVNAAFNNSNEYATHAICRVIKDLDLLEFILPASTSRHRQQPKQSAPLY